MDKVEIDTRPPPQKKQRVRIRLDNACDVRRELARLYRQARMNEVDVVDASRLANILSLLLRAIETSALEQRVEALETR